MGYTYAQYVDYYKNSSLACNRFRAILLKRGWTTADLKELVLYTDNPEFKKIVKAYLAVCDHNKGGRKSRSIAVSSHRSKKRSKKRSQKRSQKRSKKRSQKRSKKRSQKRSKKRSKKRSQKRSKKRSRTRSKSRLY